MESNQSIKSTQFSPNHINSLNQLNSNQMKSNQNNQSSNRSINQTITQAINQIKSDHIKSFVFGFIVTSIAAFKGYNVKGGALEVGKASTDAVTSACIAILAADFILADTLLG